MQWLVFNQLAYLHHCMQTMIPKLSVNNMQDVIMCVHMYVHICVCSCVCTCMYVHACAHVSVFIP